MDTGLRHSRTSSRQDDLTTSQRKRRARLKVRAARPATTFSSSSRRRLSTYQDLTALDVHRKPAIELESWHANQRCET